MDLAVEGLEVHAEIADVERRVPPAGSGGHPRTSLIVSRSLVRAVS